MANITDIYKTNSNFLKAEDLIVNGVKQKPVVEIEMATLQENTYGGDEAKKQVVLSFVGKEKVLGLNKTNATRIAHLLNELDFEKWPGWRIRLYVDQTQMQDGRTVDCIRVFPDLPEQSDEIKERFAIEAESDEAAF